MREIKFRVWDSRDNQMEPVYGFVQCDTHVKIFMSQDEEEWISDLKDNLILMQSTGLKDSNKVEIYEGDIVRETRRPPAKNELYTVEYREEVGAFMFKDQYNDYDPYIDMGEIEKIGNIYENPELIERKEK